MIIELIAYTYIGISNKNGDIYGYICEVAVYI